MPVQIENTPNPRALKFTVGSPVGGPATYTSAEDADDKIAPILDIPGVTSVFMTADFVTVSRSEEGDWEFIAAAVVPILESAFS